MINVIRMLDSFTLRKDGTSSTKSALLIEAEKIIQKNTKLF